MARKTKEQKRIEDEVNAAYKKHGNGVEVDIFHLGKIMEAGEEAGAKGENIAAAVKGALEKYRKN